MLKIQLAAVYLIFYFSYQIKEIDENDKTRYNGKICFFKYERSDNRESEKREIELLS